MKPIPLYLADVHLLAGALLAVVLTAMALVRQPAHRMALAKSTLAALALLAALRTLPGWSVLHLLAAEAPPTAPVFVVAEPPAIPMTAPPTVPPIFPQPDNVIPTPANASAVPVPESPVSINWFAVAVLVHAVGSAAVIAWLVIGAAVANRMRRRSEPAPADLSAGARAIAGALAAPAVFVSDSVAMPVALGLRCPAIILPKALAAADRNTLAPILAHEWAHIAAGDLRTLAASRLLLILLWPQPLFWFLRRRIRLDQETLADAAAAEVAGRVTYAEQLVGLARTAAASPAMRAPRLAGAVGLWEGPSQLKRRIATLLDEKLTILRAASRRWRIGTAFTALAAAAALSLVTLQREAPASAAHEATKSDQPATVDKSPHATLTGRILDEHDRPIEGVEVTLYGGLATRWKIGATKTDAHGVYKFDPCPRGGSILNEDKNEWENYIGIQIRHPDWASDDGKNWRDEQMSTSAAATSDFNVVPAGSVKGVLHDRAGRPIPSLSIRIWDDDDRDNSASSVRFMDYATTDDAGRFEVAGLFPRKYQIDANGVKYRYHRIGAVEVKAGAAAEIDLAVDLPTPLPDAAFIETDANGDTLIIPSLHKPEPAPVFTPDFPQPADANGSAAAQPPDAQPSLTGAPFLQTPTNELPAWARPEPNVFHGRIVDESAKPLAGVQLTLIRYVGNNGADGQQIATQTSAADGSFRFENVADIGKEFPDGISDEFFQQYPMTFVAVICRAPDRASKVDKDSMPDIAKRGRATQIAMPRAASLRGRITNEAGQPIAAAKVSAGGEPFFFGFDVGTAKTDAGGNYVIEDLAPYDAAEVVRQLEEMKKKNPAAPLAASIYAGHWPMLVQHPDFANKRVDIPKIPGELNVTLSPGAIIEGTVALRESSGQTKPAAEVAINLSRQWPETPTDAPLDEFEYQTVAVKADANGKYRIPSLPPGVYSIAAIAPSWVAPALQDISAAASRTTHAPEITLTHGGTVRLKPVDADTGQPLPGADKTVGWVAALVRPTLRANLSYLTSGPMAFTESVGEMHLAPGEYEFMVRIPDATTKDEFWMSTNFMPPRTESPHKVIEGEVVEIAVPMKKQAPLMAQGAAVIVRPASGPNAGTDEVVPATAPSDAPTPSDDFHAATPPTDGPPSTTPASGAAPAPSAGSSITPPTNSSAATSPIGSVLNPLNPNWGNKVELTVVTNDPSSSAAASTDEAAQGAMIVRPAAGPNAGTDIATPAIGSPPAIAYSAPADQSSVNLAVQCVDETGRPLETPPDHFSVHLYWYLPSDPVRTCHEYGVTYTGSGGKVNFGDVIEKIREAADGLPAKGDVGPGQVTFVVAAHAPGRATAIQTIDAAGLITGKAKWKGLDAVLVMPKVAPIRGRVIDSERRPVAGAVVRPDEQGLTEVLHSDQFLYAVTDSNGEFTITDVAPFDGSLTGRAMQAALEASGRAVPFEPTAVPFLVTHHDFAIEQYFAKKLPSPLEIRLQRPAILTGAVVYAASATPKSEASVSGQPASNVEVQIVTHLSDELSRKVRSRPPMASPSPDVHYCETSTRTDTEGRYRFANAPSGKYDVYIMIDGLRARVAQNVELRSGETVENTPLAMPMTGGIARVHLVDNGTGEPVILPEGAFAALAIRTDAGEPMRIEGGRTVPASKSGVVDLRIPAGKYRILCIALLTPRDDAVYERAGDFVPATIAVGEVADLTLRMKPRKPSSVVPPPTPASSATASPNSGAAQYPPTGLAAPRPDFEVFPALAPINDLPTHERETVFRSRRIDAQIPADLRPGGPRIHLILEPDNPPPPRVLTPR